MLANFRSKGVAGDFPTGLVLSGNGVLYGTTMKGGAHNGGTLFALKP